MYIAKSSHAGIRQRYDPAEDHYDPLDLSLIGEFPAAIEGGQLVLHYQPKKSIDDGSVEALEALVRWNHPTLGLLGPDRFLPLAEQTELIHRFTRWVILRALTDLQAMGPLAANLSVAVNVSARDITEEGFAAGVQSILAETALGRAPDHGDDRDRAAGRPAPRRQCPGRPGANRGPHQHRRLRLRSDLARVPLGPTHP